MAKSIHWLLLIIAVHVLCCEIEQMQLILLPLNLPNFVAVITTKKEAQQSTLLIYCGMIYPIRKSIASDLAISHAVIVVHMNYPMKIQG